MNATQEELVRFRFESDLSTGEVDTIYADDGTPVRVLRIGDAFQSGTYLDERRNLPPFEYLRRFDCMFEADPSIFSENRILLLGAGACCYPKHLMTTRGDASIVAVERDPRIIEIAREHFFLKDLEAQLAERGQSSRLEIAIDDARSYLEGTSEQFGAIINDLFDGETQDESMSGKEALAIVREHLVPDGIYLQNYVCSDTLADFAKLHDALEMIGDAFGHATAVMATDEEFSDFDNYILVGTREARTFDGAIRFGS